MAGEEGIVDRLVVAVDYDYDDGGAAQIEADFNGLIGLGAAVAAGLVGLAMSAALAGDEAHDMGIRMGLSAEEVTAWSYAADRAGTSIDVLSQGLITLQRNLGAAQQGAGPAADAFRRLGIDPKEIENADDALFHIADRLQGVADDGERASLRLTLLGEAGPKLAELLGQGSEGIEELLTRAERMGAVISDADAELSGDFLDSLSDLGEIAAGAGRKIGFAVLPSLTRVTKGIRDWYLANDDLIGQQIDRTADGIGYALDQLQTPIGKAAAGALALASAWGVAGAARSMYTAAAASSPLIAALGGQAAGALAAAKAGGPLAAVLIAAGLAIDDFLVAAEGGDSVLLDLGEAMGARGETQQAAAGLIALVWSGVDAFEAWNSVIQDKFIGTLAELAEALNPLTAMQPVLDALGVVIPDFELPELPSAKDVIGGAASAFEGAAGALDLSARAARGELTAPEQITWDAFVNRASGRAAMDQVPQFTIPISISGSSPAEVARVAGEAARREVEMQTLEALSAVGMPP